MELIGLTELKLLDMTGRLVYRRQIATSAGENMMTIELEDLNKGVYLLSLDDGEHSQKVKFVKQ